MPLTAKGEEIKGALEKEYGAEKGEQVLYAGKNKGTFTGIDGDKPDPEPSHEYPEWLQKELAKPITNSGKMNREMKTKAWQKRNSPDSATMTRIADAINNLQQRFDAMCSRGGALDT